MSRRQPPFNAHDAVGHTIEQHDGGDHRRLSRMPLVDEPAPSVRRGVRQRLGLRHWDWRARLALKLHERRGRQALAAPSCLVIGAYCVVTLFFWG